MKKITLLSMLLCMAVSVFAQKSVLFDFAASGDGLPTAATTEETYTYNGYEFTMQNCKYSEGYNGGANYLMVYQVGKGAKIDGYVTLPSFDFKIGSITVLTGSSASTNVDVALCNGDEVIETKKLNAKSAEFTWTITGDNIGTRYTLKVANAYNAQFQEIIITEASSSGTLSFKEDGDINFGIGLDGIQTRILEVLTDGLSNEVNVAVSGNGFSADVTTLPATGGNINVTFTNDAAGVSNGTITITSGSLTTTANLVGTTAAHRGSLNDPFDTADVIALNNIVGETEYWVSGVVAGSAANNGELAEETTYSNLALGTAAPYIPVQLPKGDIRSAINPYDNPDMIGKTVWVKGQLLTYFLSAGVKNVSDYSLDGINSALTAIEDVQAVGIRAYAANGYIKTTGENETVSVYNVTGKLIATGVAGRDIKVANKGIYIVKVGNKATKVVVR